MDEIVFLLCVNHKTEIAKNALLDWKMGRYKKAPFRASSVSLLLSSGREKVKFSYSF